MLFLVCWGGGGGGGGQHTIKHCNFLYMLQDIAMIKTKKKIIEETYFRNIYLKK